MALTGLEIFKQLPKTNCKECGLPTCLAFAMALANGKISLDACPAVSDEAKEALAASAAPPIRLVKVGAGDNILSLGDETELFRHDKRFNHPTAVAVTLNDSDDPAARLKAIDALSFKRVGQQYTVDMVAVVNTSGDAGRFKEVVERTVSITDKNLLLVSEDVAAMAAALPVAAARKPLLYAAAADNYVQMTELAKGSGCALAVKAASLDALAELVDKIVALGCRELVLDPGSPETGTQIARLTQIRRLAVRKKFRAFGYPTIAFTTEHDEQAELLQAAAYMAKYAGVLVVRTTKKELLLPLLSWRANLFTDPQKPVTVEPGLYAIGDAGPDSPVYCTTNFSLTYFLVEGEVDATRIPSYIIAVDTGGISVLTAYADNKFTAEKIAGAIKELNMEEKVRHRKIVIPGAVAVLKGRLEDESGWEVIVGPREASGITKFARERFS